MGNAIQSYPILSAEDSRAIAERAFTTRHPDNAELFKLVWDILEKQHSALAPEIQYANLELAVASGPDDISLAMVQEIKVYFESMMTKFPLVRDELIKVCQQVCKKQGLSDDFAATTVKQLDSALKSERLFLVVRGTRQGKVSEQIDITENGARDNYLKKRKDYDLFVWENKVWVKPTLSSLATHRQIIFRKGTIRYCVFISMLRYRGEPLPSRWLFTVTRNLQSTDVSNLHDNDFSEDLRYEIRDVKNKLNVQYLSTPDKAEGEDYMCTGNFSFCLVIPMWLATKLTMPK